MKAKPDAKRSGNKEKCFEVMTCECGGKMYCVRRYKVKGIRAGNLPGYKRTYECRTCKKTTKTMEIDPTLLLDLQEQYETRRKAWIRETAELKQKIYYLKMPVNAENKKLKKIRVKLIEMLEDTF